MRLSRAMLAELARAFEDLHAKRRSAGGDSGRPAARRFVPAWIWARCSKPAGRRCSWRSWHRDAEAYRDLLLTMLRFPKLLIAAVGGPALAGGAGLVLACDIVVAAGGGHVRLAGAAARDRGRHGRAAAGISESAPAGPRICCFRRRQLPSAEAQRMGVFHEVVAGRPSLAAR